MARRPRREAASGIHHVMNRGVDHQRVFFDDIDRIVFGRLLAHAHRETGVVVIAYCLMGNHFHLVLRAPPGALSEAMRWLLGTYTRRTNHRVGRDGPLFRGRFHSIPVETDAYLLQATRYVHRNPLDLPGVSSARAYRWSSYPAYLELRPAPPMLDTTLVTGLAGGTPEAVAHFTEGVVDAGLPSSCSIEDVRQLVACAAAIEDLGHGLVDSTRQGLARTVLVLLAERTDDPGLRGRLAAELAHPTREAVLVARRRARRRLTTEPSVQRVLAWVEARLTQPTGCA